MSKMFDYISGKSSGELARAHAAEEHALGHLEAVLAENERMRSVLVDMLAALRASEEFYNPNASAMRRAAIAKAEGAKLA